jgi:TRAP-type uncharacterized transport system fused permease subunit
VFVLDPQGIGLLLKVPPGGGWLDIVQIVLETAAGIAALAFAAQGWFLKKSNVLETVLFAFAGVLLVFPSVLDAIVRPLTGLDIATFVPGLADLGLRVGWNIVLGLVVFVVVAGLQRVRTA